MGFRNFDILILCSMQWRPSMVSSLPTSLNLAWSWVGSPLWINSILRHRSAFWYIQNFKTLFKQECDVTNHELQSFAFSKTCTYVVTFLHPLNEKSVGKHVPWLDATLADLNLLHMSIVFYQTTPPAAPAKWTRVFFFFPIYLI